MGAAANVGRLGIAFAAGLVISLALLAGNAHGRADDFSMSIVTASTAMSSTTAFSHVFATAACPSGSTLVGGGDELTDGGSPVTNDGAVTLGFDPSDSSGNAAGGGATTPTYWTAYSGYAALAPGTDAVTAYGMCLSGGPAATIVETATTSTDTLGPVTAVCPSGSSLIGGGGGYTTAVSANTKIYDSYPSDAAGDLPANGTASPTAWTVMGNSSQANAEATTAVALCATDVAVTSQIAASIEDANTVISGSAVADTVSCPSGTTLLDGGSDVTNNPSGPGTGGQGVHIIGDFPSDGSGNPVTSSSGSWTVIAEDGGQNLTSLNTEAFALCASAPTGTTSTTTGGTTTTTTTTTTPAPTTTTPTTTTTAVGGTSGSPAGASAPDQPQTVTLRAGKAGSLTVGAGAAAVVVSWPKSATGAASLTAVADSPIVPKSHGVHATTAGVEVVAIGKNGKTLSRLDAPLAVTFPGAPGNVTAAFTVDGTHWTAIPELGSSTLPSGLSDGWYRDSFGNLHVLTLHTATFGLLASGTGLKQPRKPPRSATAFHAPSHPARASCRCSCSQRVPALSTRR